MEQLKRRLLYLQMMLTLVLLPKAVGLEDMSYFRQRKMMLDEMKINLHRRPKNSKVDEFYYQQNLTHIHNYNVSINEPDLCKDNTQIFLLIMIRTHYAHHTWRDVLRETLNHQSAMAHRMGLIVKHVFMFGKSDDPNIEEGLRNESQHNRDIIQEDFSESYLHLMKKVIMAWKWAVHFCPNAEYIMIANDELLVDLEKLVYFLLQDYSMVRFDDHFAVCYPIGNGPSKHLRFQQFRVMSPEVLYRGKSYPPYCHGWGYVAHIHVINKLYKASFTNPPFMPTDVWIGVLSEKLRLKIPNHANLFVLLNTVKYFTDPFYPVRPGMIAVTDYNKNKGKELPIMKIIIKSMRKQWRKMSNISLNGDPYGRSERFHGLEDMSYFRQRKMMLDEMKINLHQRPNNSKVDEFYYKQNLTHNHNYNVSINEPDLCKDNTQIFLLIMIRTHYAHHTWRDVLREMLNHQSAMAHRMGLIVKHVFMFGKSDDPHIEEGLRNESQHNRDIIQEDFSESYLHLMKKVIMAWKWAVHFCPNAEYIMIANDELLVDLEKLVYFLLQDYSMVRFDDHFAVCYPLGNHASTHLRFQQFRVMSPQVLYRGKSYPPYCHGWGYVAHIYVINKLYKASFTNPPFMPTDIWIGVLSEKLRLKIPNHANRFVLLNTVKYFTDPFYPVRPGMIAVTDYNKNKGKELPIMKIIIKSMRKQWRKMSNISWNGDPYGRSERFHGYSDVYIAISIFTFVVVIILFKITVSKLLRL